MFGKFKRIGKWFEGWGERKEVCRGVQTKRGKR